MDIGTQRRAGQTLGVILVVIGVIFLIGQLFSINIFRLLALDWPLYILVPGLALVVLGLRLGKPGAAMTSIGSAATTVGLILWYQSRFNMYQTWAYVWSLIPVGIGIGMILHGSLTGMPELLRNGLRTAFTGVVMFVLFFVFFELLIGLSGFGLGGSSLGKLIGPALLIGLGGFILWQQRFAEKQKR